MDKCLYPMPAEIEKQKRKPTKSAIPFSNRLEMIDLINKGVSSSLFKDLQNNSLLDDADWANILDVSSKSIHRYKQSSHHFKPIHSDKIMQIAEVFSIGLDTFGTTEQFKLWLNTPNYALGETKPMELIKTSYGKELVVGELQRINYGILS